MCERCKDRFHVKIPRSRHSIWYCTSGESGSEQIEVARRRPGAAECWHERHRARHECRRGGDAAHTDIERGKLGLDRNGDKMVPSAATVACIAGGGHARVSTRTTTNQLVGINIKTVRTLILTNSNTYGFKLFSEQRGTMGRVQGYVLIHT